MYGLTQALVSFHSFLLGSCQCFFLGLSRQLLIGGFLERLHIVLIALEHTDVVLPLGADQGRALERLVANLGLPRQARRSHPAW